MKLKHTTVLKAFVSVWLFCLLLPLQSLQAQVGTNDFYQGLTYYKQGQFDMAIPLLKQAAQVNPNNEQVYIALASSYLGAKEFENVIKTANIGLEKVPDNMRLLLVKAEGYYHTKYKKAIPVYEKIISLLKQKPDLAEKIASVKQIKSYLGYLYQKEAAQAYQAGKAERAIRSYKKAIPLTPDSLSVHNNLAYLYIKTGKWDDALDILKNSVKKFPKSESLYLMLGQAYQKKELPNKMLASFHHLYELDKNNLNYAVIYGQALLMAKQVRKANRFFKELIKDHPKEKKLYDALIKINEMRYDFTAKRNILKRERVVFPNDVSVAVELADTYILLKEFPESRQVFDSLATATNQYQYYLQSARTWLYKGKFDMAWVAYAKLVKRWPDKDSLLAEAGIVTQAAGEMDDAVRLFKKAVKTGGNPLAALRLSDILFNRKEGEKAAGYLKYLQGTKFSGIGKLYELRLNNRKLNQPNKETKAKEAIKEILSYYKQLQERLFTKAGQAMNLSISIQPPILQVNTKLDRVESYVNEWYAYAINTFNYKDMIQMILDVIIDYPESSKLYYMKGKAAVEHENFKVGKSALEQSIELDARDPAIYSLLATAYGKLGNIQKAILIYEKAITVDPDYEKAYKSIVKLSQKKHRLNQLCNRWLTRYRNNPDNKLLKEYLIVALQKADRFEDARKILEGK